MKILIQSTNGGAHLFSNLGLARAFSMLGFQTYLWNNNQSAFDIFDEVNPDIFLGQTYNLNNSLIKCIQERPLLKVVLRASDRSSFSSFIAKKYPILIANLNEINLVNTLRDKTGKPDYLHNHYTQKSIEKTHEDWIKEEYKVYSSLLAADLVDFYNGQYKEEYASDICFIGGRWGYKSQTIDPYILQLCQSKYNYKIKIFGNQGWGISQYCGYAPDSELKHLMKSAKICLNVHEPHSQEYGYDIIERPFKLLSNRCFCISDYVQDLVDLIPNGIKYAKSPIEYKELIDYFLKNEDEKYKYIENGHNEVMNNHTYLDRTKEILDHLNINCKNIQEIKDKFICGL